MHTEEPSVDGALADLKKAIEHQLKAERLRDRLTQLGNKDALKEWIQRRTEDRSNFWIAFFEVDRFKNINDKFGYNHADSLLRRIAKHLSENAKDYFAEIPEAFRAHGDEFFLGGNIVDVPLKPDEIQEALDQIRGGISAIKVRVRKNESEDVMSCTVSVGWLLSQDDLAGSEGSDLFPEIVIQKLERAVSRAKQDRNCVVRLSAADSEEPTADGRHDCKDCKAKFSITIPHSRLQPGTLFCPNCGTQLERPFSLCPTA